MVMIQVIVVIVTAIRAGMMVVMCRTFQIMARAGEISPPPSPALDGLRLQPEYVSPMGVGQVHGSVAI